MMIQLPTQSVDQFIMRLREKADCCEFGETADENVHDQVIEKCLSLESITATITNNNNNLFLIRHKLTSEYDQMCLTTITTCNNYNKVYLRIPKIYNLKFINLTITGKSLPK